MGCAGLKVCRGEGNLGLREWDREKLKGMKKGIEVFLLQIDRFMFRAKSSQCTRFGHIRHSFISSLAL